MTIQLGRYDQSKSSANAFASAGHPKLELSAGILFLKGLETCQMFFAKRSPHKAFQESVFSACEP